MRNSKDHQKIRSAVSKDCSHEDRIHKTNKLLWNLFLISDTIME